MYQGTCADMYDDVTRNDSSEIDAILAAPVSYTHLTLPTIYSV